MLLLVSIFFLQYGFNLIFCPFLSPRLFMVHFSPILSFSLSHPLCAFLVLSNFNSISHILSCYRNQLSPMYYSLFPSHVLFHLDYFQKKLEKKLTTQPFGVIYWSMFFKVYLYIINFILPFVLLVLIFR
jgi:hypothetical protein